MSSFLYGYEVLPSTKNESAVIRSLQCPKDRIVATYYPEVETIYDCFMRGKSISPNDPCYGYRPTGEDGKPLGYTWFTYNEIWEKIQDFAGGLFHEDLVPEKEGYRILGVYAPNCLEWVLAEHSCNAYSMALCPIYDTLGADSVEFILQQTEMKCCICTPHESLKLLAFVESTPNLKVIVQIGAIDEKTRELASQHNIRMLTTAELMEIGKLHRVAPRPPHAEDVCTICYTSGTTGTCKGALITHRNFISALSGCLYTGIRGRKTDSYLSYLPLAHVLERIMNLAILAEGGRIGFYRGSTRFIIEDIKELRPSIFTSVPRLLNKIYDSLMAKMNASSWLIRTLFFRGIAAKQWRMENGYDNTHWFYDPIIFNTIRKKVGLENIRVTISGSAPLSKDILLFLRCLLNGVIIEGYGATETTGPTTLQVGTDYTVGNVGGGLPCCEYKLVDVPDMGYFNLDRDHNGIVCKGRGELFIRGYNITPGYFKSPEITKQAFDKDGFFATGDIAIILPNYAVKIVDRKKNFFKLAQGEYVAAEKLEIIYGGSPFIAQIFVHGDSLQSYLVAMIVPEKDYVMNWSKNHMELNDMSFEEICKTDLLKEAIKTDLARLFTENRLRGFERIQKFTLDSEMWSVDNGLLTPTFKLIRKQIQNHYVSVIAEMYKQ